MERLGKVAVVATAKGADSMRATLMTRHRWLGHPSFKTVVALAESGAGGMVIADLPKMIPGLGAVHGCREIGTLPAQGKAKSCRSVPGSSPHRHSGANAYQVG